MLSTLVSRAAAIRIFIECKQTPRKLQAKQARRARYQRWAPGASAGRGQSRHQYTREKSQASRATSNKTMSSLGSTENLGVEHFEVGRLIPDDRV
jgi:hypothetical protein